MNVSRATFLKYIIIMHVYVYVCVCVLVYVYVYQRVNQSELKNELKRKEMKL